MTGDTPPKIHWRCYLFGHVGDFYTDHYHVCDQCGLCQYYDEAEYDRAALFRRIANSMERRWRWFKWRHQDKSLIRWISGIDDEVPF